MASLRATAAGTVVVTATIVKGSGPSTNYTQDFTISVIVPITDITGVPATAVAGIDLALTGIVAPANATNKTIVWSVKSAGTTGATITGSTLKTTAVGTVVVTATVINGLTPTTNFSKDFSITVTFSGVTSITGVPTQGVVGTDLVLTGIVNPTTATYKNITWSVKNAGTTGATIV